MSERCRALGRHHINISQNSNDSRDAILFLHGVTRNWRSFYPLFDELNNDYNLMAIDFRGHGLSGRTSGSYLVTNYIEDVVALLENSSSSQQYIYGHSLGGMVALAAAAKIKNKIKGIVLEDPPFSTMGAAIKGSQLHRFFIGLSEISASKKKCDQLLCEFSNIPLHKKGASQKLFVRDIRDELSRSFSAESLMKIDFEIIDPIINGKWLTGYNIEELIKSVDCPVLLLQADELAGGMLKDRDLNLIKENLKQEIRYKHFPSVGHIIHTSKPKEILRLIRESANG